MLKRIKRVTVAAAVLGAALAGSVGLSVGTASAEPVKYTNTLIRNYYGANAWVDCTNDSNNANHEGHYPINDQYYFCGDTEDGAALWFRHIVF
ncbi:hypothetical protein GCM10010330_76840 [Streptomyces tendae]|nr:hypothetical protein GCM10010330_76840 [Streptomyces tendae]